MTGQQRSVPQSVRLLYLALYLAFLFVMNRLAFGQWLPLTTSKGLWFYSGAAALILGSLLVTPFFTSPANAVSYLVAALIAVFVFPAPSAGLDDTLPRQCLIAFCAIMLAVCTLNILFKDSKNRLLHNVAEIGRLLADHLGSPRFVYALVIAYALWEYHRTSPTELLFVGLSGLVIAAQQPLETLGTVVQRIREVWRPSSSSTMIGSVVAYQTPDIVLVRQETPDTIESGTCLLIADRHAPLRLAVALGYFGRDEGILLRALEVPVPPAHKGRLAVFQQRIPDGGVIVLDRREVDAFRSEVDILNALNSFIGIVAQDTSTEKLIVEVINERDIEQGRLLETTVGKKRVLYQVLDGLTKEEVVQHKNTYGYARAEATQIGEWDAAARKFRPCNWIPRINTAVFLQSVVKHTDNSEAVGYFPSTNFDVSIKNLDELVTHNTAILGILGVGKSMLAIELVERMVVRNVKVICVDLTNQYAQELKPFLVDANLADKIKQLQVVGPAGKTNYKKNVEEGGSKGAFAQQISKIVGEFLDANNHARLMILNPSQFEVWRQDSKMFGDTRSQNELVTGQVALNVRGDGTHSADVGAGKTGTLLDILTSRERDQSLNCKNVNVLNLVNNQGAAYQLGIIWQGKWKGNQKNLIGKLFGKWFRNYVNAI
ncbi:MAG: DUF87 domain-containing protein [bacterium]